MLWMHFNLLRSMKVLWSKQIHKMKRFTSKSFLFLSLFLSFFPFFFYFFFLQSMFPCFLSPFPSISSFSFFLSSFQPPFSPLPSLHFSFPFSFFSLSFVPESKYWKDSCIYSSIFLYPTCNSYITMSVSFKRFPVGNVLKIISMHCKLSSNVKKWHYCDFYSRIGTISIYRGKKFCVIDIIW